MVKENEGELAENLFADNLVDSSSLTSEKQYVDFGKNVADILFKG